MANNECIGILISKNDDPHHLSKTKEEFLMQIICELIGGLKGGAITPQAHEELWNKAQKKNTLSGEVIRQKCIIEMMIASWPMLSYHAKTRLFKLTYLYI